MAKKVVKKNIRLTTGAWQKLRNLKFDLKHDTYIETFEEIFGYLEKQKVDLKNLVLSEPYSETSGDVSTKTIVVNSKIHTFLGYYKTIYMRRHDATARGPGSISISQIVMTLIDYYHELKNK